MSRLRRTFVSPVLKALLGIFCKVDILEYKRFLKNIPLNENGRPAKPMIIAFNHINFLEAPLLVSHAHPVPVAGLVQEKAWKNPFMAFIFNTYDAVPINREGSYLGTFRKVHDMMKQGFFMLIAPEGTRSKDGILRTGKGGLVQLAQITGADIVPIAHFGGQNFWQNIKHFKRTPVTFRAGKPFRLKWDGKPNKEIRALMIEDIMAEIAKLLPEEMRGEYAEKAREESRYLEYLH